MFDTKKYYIENKEKIKEYRNDYYAKHKEQIKIYYKRYYIDNKDNILKNAKQYQLENREQISQYRKGKYLEYQKQYNKTHSEKRRKLSRKWYINHPERIKEIAKKHDNKRRNLGFKPLNEYSKGLIAHHIDKTYIVYIPKEVHQNISHCLETGRNMEEINRFAINYILFS